MSPLPFRGIGPLTCSPARVEGHDGPKRLPCPSPVAGRRQSGLVSLVVSRPRKRLSPPLREPQQGRSGYRPACANQWVQGLCDKPKTKCAACPHRRFLPVTNEVIYQHLSGEDAGGRPLAIGVYPLLPDETCFFWRPISTRRIGGKTLGVLGILPGAAPVAVSRSRSGNGAGLAVFRRGGARRLGPQTRRAPADGNDGPPARSAWTRTTTSFPTKTRCRGAVWAIRCVAA